MSDSSYLRRQADICDRIADQCSVPELVPYYRKLAQDYRARAASERPEAEATRMTSR